MNIDLESNFEVFYNICGIPVKVFQVSDESLLEPEDWIAEVYAKNRRLEGSKEIFDELPEHLASVWDELNS